MTGKQLRRLLALVLLAVFVVSGAHVLLELRDYRRSAEAYSEAERLVKLPDFALAPIPAPTAQPPADPAVPTPGESAAPAPAESAPPAPGESTPPYVDPYADALREMDFAALRAVNEAVVGWIVIPGTGVSYPLLQGEDNSYYLRRNWKGGRSVLGAIFLECQNSPDLRDFHTIVYGHNTKNGSMFGALQNYRDAGYLAAHPSVYLTVDGGSVRYDIFAVYQAEVDSNTYQLGFPGEADRERFLSDCMARSVLETGITPRSWDRVLTLSTCTEHGGESVRWVIQAVCSGTPPPEEAPGPEEAPPPAGPVRAENGKEGQT